MTGFLNISVPDACDVLMSPSLDETVSSTKARVVSPVHLYTPRSCRAQSVPHARGTRCVFLELEVIQPPSPRQSIESVTAVIHSVTDPLTLCQAPFWGLRTQQ